MTSTLNLAAACAALGLAACASTPAVLTSAAIPVVQNQGLPAPGGVDLVGATRPYLIAPFDKLSVEVFAIEELSRDEVQVDANGQLSFPLIGTLSVAGMTPQDLGTAIERRLTGTFVRDPQVTVNLKETVSQVVTVDGQVARPGLYPVVGRMTLQRAVATAGGLGEFADLEDVVILRSIDGQRMAGLYNIGAIRAGAYPDPEIFSNDVVIVGDSASRRMFRDLARSAPLLTTPLLILFRN